MGYKERNKIRITKTNQRETNLLNIYEAERRIREISKRIKTKIGGRSKNEIRIRRKRKIRKRKIRRRIKVNWRKKKIRRRKIG